MSHHENAFPSGLTWQSFRSLYAKKRPGAPVAEASNAWRNYKTLPKTATQAIVDPNTFAQLPGDVLRNIAGQDPRTAAVMARLTRRTQTATKDVLQAHCQKEISRDEIRQYVERFLRKQHRERKHNYPDDLNYIAIFPDRISLNDVSVSYFVTTPFRSENRFTYTFDEHGVTGNSTGEDYEYRQDLDVRTLSDTIMDIYDKDTRGSIFVLPSRIIIKDILEKRGICKTTIVKQYIQEHLRKIVASLSPLLATMLTLPQWDLDQIAGQVLAQDPYTISRTYAILQIIRAWVFLGTPGMEDNDTGDLSVTYIIDNQESIIESLNRVANVLEIPTNIALPDYAEGYAVY